MCCTSHVCSADLLSVAGRAFGGGLELLDFVCGGWFGRRAALRYTAITIPSTTCRLPSADAMCGELRTGSGLVQPRYALPHRWTVTPSFCGDASSTVSPPPASGRCVVPRRFHLFPAAPFRAPRGFPSLTALVLPRTGLPARLWVGGLELNVLRLALNDHVRRFALCILGLVAQTRLVCCTF